MSAEVARDVAGSDLKEATGEGVFDELGWLGGGDEGGLPGWISGCADTLGAGRSALGSGAFGWGANKSADKTGDWGKDWGVDGGELRARGEDGGVLAARCCSGAVATPAKAA